MAICYSMGIVETNSGFLKHYNLLNQKGDQNGKQKFTVNHYFVAHCLCTPPPADKCSTTCSHLNIGSLTICGANYSSYRNVDCDAASLCKCDRLDRVPVEPRWLRRGLANTSQWNRRLQAQYWMVWAN